MKPRDRSRLAAALVAVALGLLAMPATAPAATITVTGAGDAVADNNICSFREAITAANDNLASGAMPNECAAGDAAPTVDRIEFSIGAPNDPHVIDPTSALPAIDEVVEIDGGTQPGGDEIQLDGSSAGGDVPGLDVAASATVVRGLTIVDWLAGTTAPGIGIRVDAAAADAVIRDNVASGNSTGVRVEGDGAELTGNLIGTDSTGTAAYPNPTVNAPGIVVSNAVGTQIGGSAPGERNVISGNDGIGINLAGADTTGTRVEGNYIGTDASGSNALGNGDTGLVVSGGVDNVIGSSGAGNVISGNDTGVAISGTSSDASVVQANLIGLAADGSSPLGNATQGISLAQTTDNLIGGTGAGEGNEIAHSTTGPGISLLGDAGNSILRNSIHSNDGLGIDLDADGVTPNDSGADDDADTGPNGLQNFPELDGARTNSVDTSVQATLDSKPGRTYRVELFSDPACDDSGHGEGRAFLGAQNVQTDAAGVAAVDATVDPSSVGDQLTATATDLGSGDTSEFSACVPIDSKPEPPPAPPPAAGPADTEITLSLSAKGRQRIGKLKLDVSCGDEPCEVETSGKAMAKEKGGGKSRGARAAARKSYGLKPAQISLGAGEEQTVRLKLRKHRKSVKKLRRLLKQSAYRKRSNAKIEVGATDAAGNSTIENLRIKLRR